MAITMRRREDGFALFEGDGYAIAIDSQFSVRDKVPVIVEAFAAKSQFKGDVAELTAAVVAAINKAGE